ncbi:MAG: YbjQ family protein [Cocleimonas sp.]|nr:YbjQ family protein [Cocleimonas sp.]
MEQIIITIILVSLGYFFGRRAEGKHFKQLIERESEMNALPAMASRMPPSDGKYDQFLVSGSVVIANDYFKVFVAGLRNFFGGNMSTYETLLDRARREAVLRMKDKAKALGAEMVFNVKYEASNISGQYSKKLPIIEVHAYGTALKKNF